jgi:hypothetical protein
MSRHLPRVRHQLAGLRPRRRVSLILLILAAFSLVGTPAWAYWKSTGSGNGSAATGTMAFQVVALIGSDTTTAQGAQSTTLVPGGSASAILRVTNPNAFAVKVISVSAGAATATGGCLVSSVTFTNPTDYTAGQYSLLAGATSLLTLPAAVFMNAGAAQNCMGATYSFPVTVTVQK